MPASPKAKANAKAKLQANRSATERNARRVSRRARDDWARGHIDHERLTGNDWIDFDPIEMMPDRDVDHLFERRTPVQKSRHQNFLTYVAGNENDRIERR
eukprot:11594035-Karenia_brevis.AAC.1